MSALLVGQDDLARRYLKGRYEHKVLAWFAAVEERAWRWVNAAPDRPDKIFLVTGQTLASEYAISHAEGKTTTCAISFEAKADLPGILDVEVLMRHDIQSITASTGFEVVKKEEHGNDNPRLYSIFLEVIESRPMKIIRKSTLISRIQAAFKYVLIHVFAKDRNFKNWAAHDAQLGNSLGFLINANQLSQADSGVIEHNSLT